MFVHFCENILLLVIFENRLKSENLFSEELHFLAHHDMKVIWSYLGVFFPESFHARYLDVDMLEIIDSECWEIPAPDGCPALTQWAPAEKKTEYSGGEVY